MKQISIQASRHGLAHSTISKTKRSATVRSAVGLNWRVRISHKAKKRKENHKHVCRVGSAEKVVDMLVLFESPAGYAIFKLLDEKKLQKSDDLYKDFATAEKANKAVKLKSFTKFKDTTEALAAATAAVEGKMSKPLKKLLKKLVVKDAQEQLLVADAKLGNCIKEKIGMQCLSNSAVQELMRCLRQQTESLISGLPQKELAAMALGLAHSLSRYKLKFSPDKVDTMIVQAISLLDDLDKELNNYAMRCREWYGWHFPEMGKIVTDNIAYAKVVKQIGHRTNAVDSDLSSILPEEVEQELKEAAEISMGTEVSDEDVLNITFLCTQVIEISEYRGQLYEYLKNRMGAIAPNLTVLVGELVGARLIAHAGSLMNLAKHPSSTVQILGAEKALFRALKTKHDTPKYGLIYHASLVGQTNPKVKGKVSRMLAAKASLAIRVDALGEDVDSQVGIDHRAKLERRLRQLEEDKLGRVSGTGKTMAKWEKYENKSEVKVYNPQADSTIGQKRKFDETDDGAETPVSKKKKQKKVKQEPVTESEDETSAPPKKKKKKDKKAESAAEPETPEPSSEKKKKKKKKNTEAETSVTEPETPEPSSEKKKKKKKKKAKEDSDSD